MTENIITIKKGAGKGDAPRHKINVFRAEYEKIKMTKKTTGVVERLSPTKIRITYK